VAQFVPIWDFVPLKNSQPTNLSKQISLIIGDNKGGKAKLNLQLINQLLLAKIDYGWQALRNISQKIYTKIETKENEIIRRIYGLNIVAPNDLIRQ